MTRRAIKPKTWDVVEVPLENGKVGYGHVLGSVVVGFYALESDQRVALDEVVTSAVAFRVPCMMDAIKEGRWPIIGNAAPPASMIEPLRLWRGGGAYAEISEWRPETGTVDRPASAQEIVGLEKATIWDSRWLVQRLALFLRGEPCPWVEVA